MNRHLDDAALLEAWYLDDANSDAAVHLSTCPRCQSHMADVVAVVREERGEDGERPESFWQRQRIAITRRVAAEEQPRPAYRRAVNVAAAAILAFVLGGLVMFRNATPDEPKPAPVTQSVTASAAATEQQALDLEVPRDPWESDELKSFGNVVEWESWVEKKAPAKGEQL